MALVKLLPVTSISMRTKQLKLPFLIYIQGTTKFGGPRGFCATNRHDNWAALTF